MDSLRKAVLKATTVHQELRVVRRMLNVAVRKKFLFANPCAGVEFPARVEGLFRPHYVTWSEQQKIEFSAPEYLRNVIRIITETGLRIYKELTPMKKDQLDLENRTVWIPDSKTPSGVAEVPLTDIAADAFRRQLALSGPGHYLFPSDGTARRLSEDVQDRLACDVATGRVRYFRLYDLRSTYATRLSAGGVADEWVTQLLRQGDAKVFKKYSQMKLQMKREALTKINRQANESGPGFGTVQAQLRRGFGTVLAQSRRRKGEIDGRANRTTLLFSKSELVGAGRFERPTPCAQGRCATRLRYAPTFDASLILNHFPHFRYCPAAQIGPKSLRPWQNRDKTPSVGPSPCQNPAGLRSPSG